MQIYVWRVFLKKKKMKVSLTFVTLLSMFHFQWLHATFRRAEFEFRPFNHLNVTRLVDMFVDEYMDCSFACLHNILCVSFNVAVSPDDNGKFRCELLPSTSSNNPANLTADPQSHLYQIKVSRKALVKYKVCRRAPSKFALSFPKWICGNKFYIVLCTYCEVERNLYFITCGSK